MSTASTLDELRPGLGQLARALATGEDRDVIVAARALDLGALNAFLYPSDPIIITPIRSTRRTISVRERTARKLEKAAADPYSSLTNWERNFVANVVLILRSDETLSAKQVPVVELLIRKTRRRS